MGSDYESSPQRRQYEQYVSLAATRGWGEDWYGLGCVLHNMKRHPAAAGCFARCLELEPRNHRALTNYGWSLHLSGRSGEAKDILLRAIEIDPEQGTPYALMSQVAGTLDWTKSALEYAEMGVELEKLPINYVALAFAQAGAGLWKEAWQSYEMRIAWKMPDLASRPFRFWRGEWVPCLFIEFEQGIGDGIFASRWILECLERVDRIIVYVPTVLYSLMARNFEGERIRVYPMPRPLPALDEVDAWVPCMSLPAALGKGGGDGEKAEGYLCFGEANIG
jgi:hypothetical protein